ncbi:acyltransferase [Sphingomonas rhizophila]|uniref:Acyltransferase n=1 Tax=Sphingomonas rhizophila TaxID=2071607 RepID=A0A7G9SCW3_9SPHN|nr:acyltransferase [Sphingomonas rhizophila]QNN65688.1 acyltransferase [Sphingomonas rhizophila]
MRGLAACAILFWHYQHFTGLGKSQVGKMADYPLYSVFRLLYEHGGLAVQLFWIISGFVFAAVYQGSRISGRDFALHRIARLHPLHLVTLLVVAGLQIACGRIFGAPLIYPNNSPATFIAHLAFASGWGIWNASSFNGPIWSVSAEVFIYALFWASLGFLFRWRLVLPLAASAIFFLLRDSPIAACGAYFFMGCSIYVIHRAAPVAWQVVCIVAGVTAFAALLVLGKEGIAVLALFAALVLACAMLEATRASRWAKAVPWVADNTYGVYLWHVPIQLMILLAMHQFGVSTAIFTSPWFLFFFLAAVIVVARLSFIAIERPARRAIRGLHHREAAARS